MGRDKALLPWQSGSFLSCAIEALQAHVDMVLVVAGKNASNLGPIVAAAGAFLIVNRHPEQGQFSSLRLGVQEVLNRGRDAAIITLVDRPPARSDTIGALRERFIESDPGIWAVVPRYGERNGHPLVAGREMIGAFLDAPATSTAREVEHANQKHIEYFPVDDPLVVTNVDTPQDYERITTT